MSKFETCCCACGSIDVKLIPNKMSDGRLFIRGECKDCGISETLGQNQPPNEFVMPFGKHKGKTLTEIDDADPGYVDWVINKSDLRPNIKDKFLMLRS